MAHGQPSYPLKDGEVRKQRELGGMTLRVLADRCAAAGEPISNSQLSKIERGLNRPRPALLVTLASVFGVDVKQLVETSGS
ncbi:helix-turn-helix transcriptional regulator [Lentzea sp. BCCO 10_0798]|uniref:Helix-turn-helix transcriptional regulator n=1 Tax=Lentzea kristufekii TaxID=3095430 RepID=A0ABU4TQ73_9PSEU|nr:helix-turn-helix transcriptional regulator [Lentzea sp. BCCO 10_0798]MDX8050436.1 helix-turn-helix transcriptional regulator [Lentzea sp. BCCO 10_0798]